MVGRTAQAMGRCLNARDRNGYLLSLSPPAGGFFMRSSRVNRCFGTIKAVNDRGFAFFQADHGIDCFVHYKEFEKAGLAEPKVGGRYSFIIEPTAKGPKAVDLEAE
jgi:cold shock CspA family protein